MSQNFAAAIAKFLSGGLTYLNVGATGDLLTAAMHGESYEASIAGDLFVGGNTGGVTTSVGLNVTYVGCCLSNPAASTKNLSLKRVSGSLIVAPATITSIFLAGGWAAGGITVHTTPLTPLAALLGDTSPTIEAKLDSACTLVGSPAYLRTLGQTPDATHSVSFDVDLKGGIVIEPGGWAAIATNIASPANGFMGFFEWEEIAIP